AGGARQEARCEGRVRPRVRARRDRERPEGGAARSRGRRMAVGGERRDEPAGLPGGECSCTREDPAGERDARRPARGVRGGSGRRHLGGRLSRTDGGQRRVGARAGDRRGARGEPAAGRDIPGRQGRSARLPRRSGDEGDTGEGRPEGRQPAAPREAPAVVSSSSGGAPRIDELNVPTTAAVSVTPIRTPTVSRGETALRSSPAASGPSGTTSA